MPRHSQCSVVFLAALTLCTIGCMTGELSRGRKYADQGAAVQHLRNHETAFHSLASEWLASGNRLFCAFGKDGLEWNGYWMDRDRSGWSVRYPGKDDWIKRHVQSEEQAAEIVQTTSAEIDRWRDAVLALDAECIKTISMIFHGHKADYVQIAFRPVLHQYGFRYAPQEDTISHEALAKWTSITRPAPQVAMVALGGDWFYYEGWDSYPRAPFSAITGTVLYSNGESASKIDVKLNSPYRLSSGGARTNQIGRFRADWIPSGKYVIGAYVYDVSSDSYRLWYYPGVVDPEEATEFKVGEEQQVDIGTWTLPVEPPPRDK